MLQVENVLQQSLSFVLFFWSTTKWWIRYFWWIQKSG